MSGRHAAPERPDMKAPPDSPTGRGFCFEIVATSGSCREARPRSASRTPNSDSIFKQPRSEVLKPSLPRSAYDFVLATRSARGVDESSAQRGRGERRMPVAPAASRALGSGRTHTSKRVHRNHPTFPHAMVLTVSFVLLCPKNLPEYANGRFSPTARRWV
jgi:hypothetical protein